jgi:integrin beta 3
MPAGPGQAWRDLTTTGEHPRAEIGAAVRAGGPDAPGPVAPGAVGRRAGARSEARSQLREVERLRRITLVAVVLLVLGAYPSFLLVQAATRDPAINSLDALALPEWAARGPSDEEFGSRWCFGECRFRERTATSERAPDETSRVYEQVLADAGWIRWNVERCPENPVPGSYSCWRRDEYTLDLWVRDPSCASDPVRNRPTVGPTGAPASGAPGQPAADDCRGSVVSIKVRNAIADDRGRGGAPPPPPENPDFPELNPSGTPIPTGTPS